MRGFGWKNIRFRNECSLERGTGFSADWVFCTKDQVWGKEMVDGFNKGKGLTQMFWACFSWGMRNELIDMERDQDAPKNGYTSKSYVWALQEDLVPVYEPGDVFQQDDTRIHTAKWSTD
jgi:hypothetical protein